jgi:hypothetical protein
MACARRAVAALLVLELWAGPVCADPAPGYRLAGVMTVGRDYMAVVAQPDGTQVLLRKGSEIDGGRVVGFTERSVRIEFPGRSVELVLDGGVNPAPAAQAIKLAAADAAARRIQPPPQPRTIEATAGTVRRLALARPKETGRADPARAVAQAMAPILDLPPTARVVEVNEQPVTNADAALNTMAGSLDNNSTARLSVDTPNGRQRVYLTPYRN